MTLSHPTSAIRPATSASSALAAFSTPLTLRTLRTSPALSAAPLSAGQPCLDAAMPAPCAAHLALAFGAAASLEVRVWNEDEFLREGRAYAGGIHVVLSRPHAWGTNAGGALDATDLQALRESLAAGNARLLLVARSHTLALDAPRAVASPAFRGGLPPGALRRVRDFVAQRLAEKIELRQLADVAGLSVCHFSRAFKQSMGVPPHRYLMRERVSAAALLIRTTDRPLAEISLEVGFSDQSHFTRCFSDAMGDTPRDYRRRHR